MTSQVLARKWRPQNFDMLIGQEHVLKALVNGLKLQRLHHAYLFTGTRGVGKTTLARIFAKCLNCDKGVTAEPCGECPSCKDIEAGRFVDLIEIDAASKTKVEDTREILDNVMYAPTQGRCKVYLIDEVHMLSGHSFNALLKTLEEPPSHVKFLLATTDPQKLPITILSRCLQLHLKQLTPEQITPHLEHVLQQEQVSYETKALELISQAANGSMRDALSLLDQAIAYCANQINAIATAEMLGIQGQQHIIPLAQAIIERNIESALATTQQLAQVSADFNFILSELTKLLHDIAIKQASPSIKLQQLNWDDADLQKLAQICDATDLQMFYQIALLARRDLPLAATPQIGFEMALLRMLAFTLDQPQSNAIPQNKPQVVTNHVRPTTAAPAQTQTQPVRQASATEVPPWETTNTVAEKPVTTSSAPAPTSQSSPAVTIDINAITPANWVELVPQLGLTALTKALAEHLQFESNDGAHFYFNLAEQYAHSLQERHRQNIIKALGDYFKTPINITVQIGQGKHKHASVVEHKQHQHQQKTEATLQSFQQDPQLQAVLKQFDATLVTESVKPKEA